MKLAEFGLLADENVSPTVVAFLRERGSDVLGMKEENLRGSDDADLIKVATAQKRIILTHYRDFGKLAIARMDPLIGIVFLRPGHIDPSRTTPTLQGILDMEFQVRPPFIIVGQRNRDMVTIRVRQI